MGTHMHHHIPTVDIRMYTRMQLTLLSECGTRCVEDREVAPSVALSNHAPFHGYKTKNFYARME